MSDEQVSELRYIEELEAEVEKLRRSTVHALYQGQKKRAEAAEAEVEVEKLRDENFQLEQDVDTTHQGLTLRLQAAEAKLAEVEKLQTATNERLGDAYLTIERARELAEGKDVMGDVTGKHLNDRALLKEIARLLSGKAE